MGAIKTKMIWKGKRKRNNYLRGLSLNPSPNLEIGKIATARGKIKSSPPSSISKLNHLKMATKKEKRRRNKSMTPYSSTFPTML